VLKFLFYQGMAYWMFQKDLPVSDPEKMWTDLPALMLVVVHQVFPPVDERGRF
jgi:hypothetical protein